jgi:uncharacterized protein YdeI (YjbR/CyaY-like superfamily)
MPKSAAATGHRDPRIDDYISRSAEFAQPILRELRARVHAACPGVEESIRWGMPTFLHHGILAGMAAFKAHCAFNFWKSDLLAESAVGSKAGARESLEALGRMTRASDLPSKRLFAALAKEAVRLNAEGVKAPRAAGSARSEAAPHPEFARALRGNAAAREALAGLAPSARREYIEWVADAKRDETRARRIAQAVEQLADGKKLHWKYER